MFLVELVQNFTPKWSNSHPNLKKTPHFQKKIRARPSASRETLYDIGCVPFEENLIRVKRLKFQKKTLYDIGRVAFRKNLIRVQPYTKKVTFYGGGVYTHNHKHLRQNIMLYLVFIIHLSKHINPFLYLLELMLVYVQMF